MLGKGRLKMRVIRNKPGNMIFMMAMFSLALFFMETCSKKKESYEAVTPPMAKKTPKELSLHGHTRIDNYYWLAERDNPEVIEYLKAENEYTEKAMAHTVALQETLFEEIKERTKETDLSVPMRRGDYFYYERKEEGKEYTIYARKRGFLEAPEEIMLDVNEMAPAKGFFAAGLLKVSPKQDILAFFSTKDAQGFGTIHFKNLDTGKMLEDKIKEIKGRPSIMSWANDNRTLFYLRYRSGFEWHQVYRHTLGTDPAEDVLVYEETDKNRSCWLPEIKSQRYLIISTIYNTPYGPGCEHRSLEADKPTSRPKLLLHRDWSVHLDIDQFGDHFYFLTSDGGGNTRLMRMPVDQTERESWEEVIPHRDDFEVTGFQIFRNHLVVAGRMNGRRQLLIHPWSGDEEHFVDFGETPYVAVMRQNPELDSEVIQYYFSSFTTPDSVYAYNMRTREKILLKREEVAGGFDPDDYISERLYAPARDGVRIPISIVHRKELKKDGRSPLLVEAYGSYGSPLEAVFNVPRLSLLDRGFAFAIAHVRGGGDLGLKWHEDGKLLKKKNTFNDLIDVAEYLVAQKYTNPQKLFATGRSAGGTLMAAVANMRPDLFKGIIAEVPFVNPLDGDPDMEFGNSDNEEHYRYMLSYSPYDNVTAKDYPNMLVITALNDTSVPYWGPAKLVAKLRALKTGKNLLILRTNMEGGHSAEPKRYQRWRDTAFGYAFLLDLAGIKR